MILQIGFDTGHLTHGSKAGDSISSELHGYGLEEVREPGEVEGYGSGLHRLIPGGAAHADHDASLFVPKQKRFVRVDERGPERVHDQRSSGYMNASAGIALSLRAVPSPRTVSARFVMTLAPTFVEWILSAHRLAATFTTPTHYSDIWRPGEWVNKCISTHRTTLIRRNPEMSSNPKTQVRRPK
jgi:hypothetical protein